MLSDRDRYLLDNIPPEYEDAVRRAMQAHHMDMSFKLPPPNVKIDLDATLRRILDEKIANGDIRLEIKSGGELLPEAVQPACFTLDKTKYRLRLSDETEESVKVWIEPIER